MNVLFEMKDLPELENIKTVHIQDVNNKELIRDYLAKTECIQTVIKTEPTSNTEKCVHHKLTTTTKVLYRVANGYQYSTSK